MVSQSFKIFFCYARSDATFVLRLATDLRAAGIDIWLDQLDIPAGQRWDKEIQVALVRCECLIIILSPNSVASTNVMDEVSFALEEGKQVIPLVYKNCNIPFRIRRLQHINFVEDYQEGLNKLLPVLDMHILFGDKQKVADSMTNLKIDQDAKQLTPDNKPSIRLTIPFVNLQAISWKRNRFALTALFLSLAILAGGIISKYVSHSSACKSLSQKVVFETSKFKIHICKGFVKNTFYYVGYPKTTPDYLIQLNAQYEAENRQYTALNVDDNGKEYRYVISTAYLSVYENNERVVHERVQRVTGTP